MRFINIKPAATLEWINMLERLSWRIISALAYAVVHQLSAIDDMKLCTIDTVGAYLYQDYSCEAEALFLKLEPAVAIACGLEPSPLYRMRKIIGYTFFATSKRRKDSDTLW